MSIPSTYVTNAYPSLSSTDLERLTMKNVVDYLQSYDDEFIRDFLAPSRLPMQVACENISGDFNKSSVIRSAEGFNLSKVWLVGDKKWDRRGAVGAHNRIPWEHRESLSELPTDGYRVVALDNIPGAIPIHLYRWNPKTILVVGEERRGVSSEGIESADDVVYIPMMGAVRSFNVASAASMAMYDYALKTTGFAGDRDKRINE